MTASDMLQDPDSSVRETAADALGQIAEHLYKQHNLLLPGETASNPVLRAAFDTMLEHKKEMQQAGAHALSQAGCLAACFLAPVTRSCQQIPYHELASVVPLAQTTAPRN